LKKLSGKALWVSRMRKYLVCFVMAMLIVQLAFPGANRAFANGERSYVLVNEFGNGQEAGKVPPGVELADVDWTKADQVGFTEIQGAGPVVNGLLDMTVDASGNLYFTHWGHSRVYKVTPTGDVSTFFGLGDLKLGKGTVSISAGQQPAIGREANLVGTTKPKSLAVDSHNNIYIAEEVSGKIYKVNFDTNKITDIYQYPYDSGNIVENIALDASGNLYVYQQKGSNNTYILGKLNVNESDGSHGEFTPITDIALPSDYNTKFVRMAVDSAGDLYFTQRGAEHAVKKYSFSDEEWITFASGVNSDFSNPRYIVFDADDNAYITTTGDIPGNSGNQIIKVTQGGAVSRIAGSASRTAGYSDEGTEAINGLLYGPHMIAIHPVNGTLYFEDRFNRYIRSIQPAFKIEYHGSGHTDGTLPGDQLAWAGNPATIAGHGSLVKTGHTFVKWNTAADGLGTDYSVGAPITPTADLELYAIWETEKYNLIYFAGENGTLTLTDDPEVSVSQFTFFDVPYNTRGDSVTAVPNPGYAFVGWSDGIDTPTREDTASGYLGVTANFLKEHTVTFDTSGGTPIGPQIVLDGQLLTLPTPPTYGDLDFYGWYTDSERTMQFNDNTPITTDLTLYASWETKHTVSLNPNNGQPVSNISVTEAAFMSPPADPVRAGHTFEGWYTDDTSFTQQFNFETTPIMGNISLYAKWDTIGYLVTFHTNGGTAIDSQTVQYDTHVVGPVTTTREGHTFDGWYTDAGLSTAFDITNTVITSATELYAKWTINDYTVTFNTNGGTAIVSQTVQYNTLVVGPVTTTREGHTFDGWYTDAGLTAAFDIEHTPVTGATQLYAKWGTNGYTVTFNTNGGTEIDDQTVQYNTLVAAPVTTTREGHTFDGWYKDPGLTAVFDITNTVITSATQLYAKWTINDYTVTFNTNGGTAIVSQTVQYNALVVGPVTTTREGHTFNGWYTDTGLTAAFDIANTPVTGITLLYAKWDTIGYPVTFHTNGGTAIDSQTVQYNARVAGPVTTTRDGYSFAGWYTDSSLTSLFDIANAVITSATELYAKWTLTPPGAPAIVSTTPGDGKVELVWNGVPHATGYKVYQGTTSGTLGTDVASVSNSVYGYEATGLTNGVTYYFVVSALNDAGENESIEVSATPMTLAAAPTDVTAVAGDGRVTVTFVAPVDNGGGAITEYRVTSTPGNLVVTTTSTTVMITGLTNGTAYTFTVEARNALGYGAMSAPSSGVTPVASSSGGGSTGGGGGGSAGGGGGGNAGTVVSTDGELTLPAGTAGEAKLGDGITVTIPAGASNQELKLTIEQISNIEGLTGGDEVFASPVYELLKNLSDNFAKPVQLTFKFDASKVQEGQRAAIFYYDDKEKSWIEIGGKVNGDTITAEVDFSAKFAVLAVDERATESSPVSYTDLAGHWAATKIAEAVQLGIVSGYVDGTFKPNALITRAEFSVMLARALKLDGQGEPRGFIDEEKIGAWARNAVRQAAEAGIISGYGDNSFRPSAKITRAELAVMIARAYSTEAVSAGTSGFADESEIPGWATSAVSLVKKLGIVSGKQDNKFAPQDSATRAEAVTMIINLLQVNK